MNREPAVAGAFYPAGADALAAQVDRHLAAAAAAPGAAALGVVVPHAGYVYSGAVAGAVYARIAVPRRVIVLGPNHTGLGASDAALWPDGGWRTPLGTVPVDGALSRALSGAAGVAADPLAHAREHSLEVQLPFLQRARPDVAIAALCLGHLPWPACEALGWEVGRAAGEAGALVVASTDMSHYVAAEEARAADARVLERIAALDPPGVHALVHRERISMCGVIPTTVMLVAALAMGARRAEVIRWAHSGEVSGDHRRVVGYAGVVIS